VKARKPIRKKSSKRREAQAKDLVIKEAIHERDAWKCIRCGRERNLQAAHVWPKGKYKKLRHVEENVMTLCAGCHLWWHHDSPVVVGAWFANLYPERAKLLHELKLKG
jgi:5-methylcytosine-specific restriction endonuclease McrA